MRHWISRVAGTLVMAGSILATACGAQELRQEDIRPISPVEAQAVSEPTLAVAPAQATPTQARPTPTRARATATPPQAEVELPTEIQEGSSPIVPTPPGKADMSANRAAAPLPGSEAALAAAIAELVKQAGVPAGQVSLVSVEAVDWNDASLGCPQPEMMYAQVITPGYKFVFTVGGQEYEVHTDQGRNAVICKP